jgi:hypothetical protein
MSWAMETMASSVVDIVGGVAVLVAHDWYTSSGEVSDLPLGGEKHQARQRAVRVGVPSQGESGAVIPNSSRADSGQAVGYGPRCVTVQYRVRP